MKRGAKGKLRNFGVGNDIDRALEAAVAAARQDHKRAGNPICEYREGKVVWIKPEEIEE